MQRLSDSCRNGFKQVLHLNDGPNLGRKIAQDRVCLVSQGEIVIFGAPQRNSE
jgi:hypothetical protein